MVKDMFGTLLEDLGKLIKVEKLEPDQNNSCLISFTNGVKVQLEIDHARNLLIIGCDLGSIPPGRYRETIFREALKSNGLPPPRHGNFAFSKRQDHLVMSEELPMKDIHPDQIHQLLEPFLTKAKEWQEAILRGDTPTILQGAYRSSAKSGMFGLT